MTAMKKEADDAAIPASEVHAALETVLASRVFANAPRMRRLLRFLVEKAISRAVRDTNEYAIGIKVFDREPSTYNVSEDPVVRVQIGRLREKLKVYYATLGTGSGIEISIPIGSHKPFIQRKSIADAASKHPGTLAIRPFKCISLHQDAAPFTQGLNEEFMHQLFKAFGKIIVAHSFFTLGEAGVNHLLEGSIQIDSERIRASIRVIDVSAGCITWSEQFDRSILFAITHQEELASSICDAVKHFFGHS
jgi:TolB-like protein